jgi:hypothetical protein
MAKMVMLCNQSDMLRKYASDATPEVRAAAGEGVCTALSTLFAKLSSCATKEEEVVTAFAANEQECVRLQVIAKHRHQQDGSGYGYIFQATDLKPKTSNFVPFQTGNVSLTTGEPVIHTFDVGNGARHTICHARLTSGELATFDPNYGIMVAGETEWNSAMVAMVNLHYPQSREHEAVIVAG